MSEFIEFWAAHEIVSLIGGGIALGAVLLLALAARLLDKVAETRKKRRKKDGRHDL